MTNDKPWVARKARRPMERKGAKRHRHLSFGIGHWSFAMDGDDAPSIAGYLRKSATFTARPVSLDRMIASSTATTRMASSGVTS